MIDPASHFSAIAAGFGTVVRERIGCRGIIVPVPPPLSIRGNVITPQVLTICKDYLPP